MLKNKLSFFFIGAFISFPITNAVFAKNVLLLSNIEVTTPSQYSNISEYLSDNHKNSSIAPEMQMNPEEIAALEGLLGKLGMNGAEKTAAEKDIIEARAAITTGINEKENAILVAHTESIEHEAHQRILLRPKATTKEQAEAEVTRSNNINIANDQAMKALEAARKSSKEAEEAAKNTELARAEAYEILTAYLNLSMNRDLQNQVGILDNELQTEDEGEDMLKNFSVQYANSSSYTENSNLPFISNLPSPISQTSFQTDFTSEVKMDSDFVEGVEAGLVLGKFREALENHPTAERFVIHNEEGDLSIRLPVFEKNTFLPKKRSDNMEIKKALKATLNKVGFSEVANDKNLFPSSNSLIDPGSPLTAVRLREIFERVDQIREAIPVRVEDDAFTTSQAVGIGSNPINEFFLNEIRSNILKGCLADVAALMSNGNIINYNFTNANEIDQAKEEANERRKKAKDNRNVAVGNAKEAKKSARVVQQEAQIAKEKAETSNNTTDLNTAIKKAEDAAKAAVTAIMKRFDQEIAQVKYDLAHAAYMNIAFASDDNELKLESKRSLATIVSQACEAAKVAKNEEELDQAGKIVRLDLSEFISIIQETENLKIVKSNLDKAVFSKNEAMGKIADALHDLPITHIGKKAKQSLIKAIDAEYIANCSKARHYQNHFDEEIQAYKDAEEAWRDTDVAYDSLKKQVSDNNDHLFNDVAKVIASAWVQAATWRAHARWAKARKTDQEVSTMSATSSATGVLAKLIVTEKAWINAVKGYERAIEEAMQENLECTELRIARSQAVEKLSEVKKQIDEATCDQDKKDADQGFISRFSGQNILLNVGKVAANILVSYAVCSADSILSVSALSETLGRTAPNFSSRVNEFMNPTWANVVHASYHAWDEVNEKEQFAHAVWVQAASDKTIADCIKTAESSWAKLIEVYKDAVNITKDAWLIAPKHNEDIFNKNISEAQTKKDIWSQRVSWTETIKLAEKVLDKFQNKETTPSYGSGNKICNVDKTCSIDELCENEACILDRCKGAKQAINEIIENDEAITPWIQKNNWTSKYKDCINRHNDSLTEVEFNTSETELNKTKISEPLINETTKAKSDAYTMNFNTFKNSALTGVSVLTGAVILSKLILDARKENMYKKAKEVYKLTLDASKENMSEKATQVYQPEGENWIKAGDAIDEAKKVLLRCNIIKFSFLIKASEKYQQAAEKFNQFKKIRCVPSFNGMADHLLSLNTASGLLKEEARALRQQADSLVKQANK